MVDDTAGLVSTIKGQDPRLGPLADNGGPTLTHALLSGSPAIDFGNNTNAVDADGNPLSTDQRGFVPRVVNDRVDLGAVEFGAVEDLTITSPATTFVAGQPGVFVVTTLGFSTTPALSIESDLPEGVTFTDNGNGTATLSGTPAPDSGRVYPLTFTASNGVNPPASQ